MSERAVLVVVEQDGRRHDLEDVRLELAELTRTSGGDVVEQMTVRRERPTPNLYIGKGKALDIAQRCQALKANVVIFNDDLSSTQQRNLEELIPAKTIDRTQLILDIFSQHAHSLEGKLQVELAQLEYLLPRLVGKGILLSRLGGGIGTRGPGEQKLEVDRRRIKERITRLKRDLVDLQRRRHATRRHRDEFAMCTIAIVGYTNAGKSTLMNALTHAGVLVEDKLFSTLDPVTRAFVLPNKQKVLFTDTVGFLHDLPHHLIEAFQATLEEVSDADLLIHVVDASHPHMERHLAAVRDVLHQLDADRKPVILALNKIDLLPDRIPLAKYKDLAETVVPLSAKTEEGVQQLVELLTHRLAQELERIVIEVPHKEMKLAHLIHEAGQVLHQEYTPEGVRIEANVPRRLAAYLNHR